MRIRISEEPFDPWDEVRAHQTSAVRREGQFGATAVFVGTMRDFNEGDDVAGMTLEH